MAVDYIPDDTLTLGLVMEVDIHLMGVGVGDS
jgi:hypothetical protein